MHDKAQVQQFRCKCITGLIIDFIAQIMVNDVKMKDAAQRVFEIENQVSFIDPARDVIYRSDEQEQKQLAKEKPWASDPNYFKNARISAVALLKMVIHARSGGSIEVMGMMTGKIVGDAIVVMDAFPLPVEGTETRVNPQAEAYEYMVEYLSTLQNLGRPENIVGWYHSHPGYGCWLSGIDVGTQSQNQQFQDPFLAVVVDPNRTISAGKVDIGAFRTYPENHKRGDGSATTSSDKAEGEYQTIPLAKMEDFGAHASQYYSLQVSHFKSSLDTKLLELLWNKYWVSTLSQSPFLNNREYVTQQILDLSRKINRSDISLSTSSAAIPSGSESSSSSLALGPKALRRLAEVDHKETELDKFIYDTNKIASEEIHGLLSQTIKHRVFSNIKTSV
ncbi:JAB1/Mov34/MPN/PAD-1 ubiquitin protease-domain-containing protein [Lipomyces japonicus]|uniref:JAB1/Mov34/MPN/PAD-1 ubiquitin protease-domain-containing protein n=1 Tax=Lipomyces japonicus TaxID=56871 RepID=UPI0034CE6F9E